MRARDMGVGGIFSSISCRHLSRDLHILLECVCIEPLHVHLGRE